MFLMQFSIYLCKCELSDGAANHYYEIEVQI